MDKKTLLTFLTSQKVKLNSSGITVAQVKAIATSLKEVIARREGPASNFIFGIIEIISKPTIASSTAVSLLDLLASYEEIIQLIPEEETYNTKTSPPFVNLSRLDELRSLQSEEFDFSRIIKLCEELNFCYPAGCYLSVTMLTRTILNHFPPVFGCSTFTELVNNYNGGKSFKQTVQHLEDSSRKIADGYLHQPMRVVENLPNSTQVNFSRELDLLLAEACRITQTKAKKVHAAG